MISLSLILLYMDNSYADKLVLKFIKNAPIPNSIVIDTR